MSDEQRKLEAGVAAMEAQRATLGDDVVDVALAGLRARLAVLRAAGPSEPAPDTEPAQTLRQVSILFLDVVGSTMLSRHLDPEETGAVMDGVLRRGTAVVQAHHGRVLQYAGDSILAAFGSDETTEDDAERAVRCGLSLLELGRVLGAEIEAAHGHKGCDVRVGVHTGAVLLGGGTGGAGDESAIRGLAVNIAARMEQSAPAGALRISQDTWALVRGLFDAQAQPPLAVKGVEAPLASWLVKGLKPRAFRLHARGVRGQETPLVGRQVELARFKATLETILTDRTPRALTVIADAGRGKSRLLQEFQHILSAHASTWWLIPARSQPSSALLPYGLLRDLLARRLEIADSDSAEVARAKLVQGLAPWLNQVNDPAPELLGHLIGLDFSAAVAVQRLGGDARLLRDRAVTAMRLWLTRLAASDGSPVVLLLDDLHWADDASLEALAALLKSATGPLLALLCARPGLIERVPNWGEGLPQHDRLTLQPLDVAQASALTQSLLQRLNPVPTELAELIERRAEGNPYYAEELVGMLLDQGVISTGRSTDRGKESGVGIGSDGNSNGEWRFHPERLIPQRLPTTLTGVLQARLDALDPDARRALQMASVIGPVFWDDALGALDARGPGALPALQRKALVQPRPTSAFRETAEEAFQHNLLHQVSYDTVLKPQKREAHARTAAWLRQRVGDRSDEYVGITAEHYARAGEPAIAVEWFLRAAHRAENGYAFKESLQHLERAESQAALQAEPLPPALKARMLQLRGRLSDYLALREQQARAIGDLLTLGEAHGELRWVACALTAQSLLAYFTGQLELAETAGRRGAEVAENIDDATSAALCRGNLAWMAIERRAFELARLELAAATRWAALARQRMELPSDGVYEVQMLLIEAELHSAQNDDSAAGAALTRAVGIAGDLHAPRLECSCLEGVARLALSRAELTVAAAHIETMARLAAEFGLAHNAAIAQECRARMHLQAGQWREAEREAAASGGNYTAAGDAVAALKCRNLQAEALWRDGQVGAAVVIWQETVSVLQQRGNEIGARAVRLRLADAMAGSGRVEDIDAARQAVRAELPLLQAWDALAGAEFALAARLAGWRVLHRAGYLAAAGQLTLAAAELEQVINGFSDPEVRERVRNAVPWHRDVVEAVG